MIDLKGKNALVTGGSRGIGVAIAKQLAKAGANIYFTSRNPETADLVIKEIEELGVQCFSSQGDIKNQEFCIDSVKDAQQKMGSVDILVNNAGITKDNLVMRMSVEDWNDVIDTNLSSVFYMTKAVIRGMVKAKSGKIINIGSIVGTTGNPGQANYSATKAGLIGFTKSIAKEFGSRNICCNVVAPGFIETDMTSKLSDAQRESLVGNIPLQRMGSANEIANTVAFLASDLANYITGTVLHVNGGMN